MRRCPFNERYFRQITTESQAYWLGFIAADGCVTGGSLQINLAGKDAAHLKALSDAIELNRSPRMGTSNFNTSVARFAVTNEALVSDLMSLGIVPRKSACLKPWSGPPDLMRPYWRGLFDGDGCITSGSNGTGRRYWRVSMNGTEDIVRGLVAASLLPCPVRPHASIWRSVWMGTAQPRSILRYLYDNSSVHLPRKFALYERVCRELHPVE